MLLPDTFRDYFPFFQEDNPYIYFDNASTTLLPYSVIRKLEEVYTHYPMNIHRGAYHHANQAVKEYENSRKIIQKFINASFPEEIIFTKGCTEAINLLAQTLHFTEDDEIIISEMEHHSNFAPWVSRTQNGGPTLKVIPVKQDGTLDLEEFKLLVNKNTKLVSITYASNVLGTVNPIKEIVTIAKSVGASVLVDAAQAVAHIPLDVQKLNIDYLCFSGHKMFAPFGVGVFYGKKTLLHSLPPFHWGGGMVDTVSQEHISAVQCPQKFEAGTPPIANVIALGAAVRFIQDIGFEKIHQKEQSLCEHLHKELGSLSFIQLLGNYSSISLPIRSFTMENLHPHDLCTFLDQERIAIRSGHHCAQPLMKRFGMLATNRASLSFYNTHEEINFFIKFLKQAKNMFML